MRELGGDTTREGTGKLSDTIYLYGYVRDDNKDGAGDDGHRQT